MSQAYRSVIKTFREGYESGMRGYWIGWRSPKGSTAFADTLEAIKELPLLYRKYDPDAKLWWIAVEALPTLAEDLEDLDSYSSQWRRIGSRTKTPPSAPYIPDNVQQAFRLLHLAPDAPLPLVEASRRVYAVMYHPDKGGDTATMRRFNDAVDIAKKWAEAAAA